MENARLLEERLRRIIKEISRHTGGEIKADLLKDLEARWQQLAWEQNQQNTLRTLTTIKQALDKL
ncbi:MAG: hypothetical protein AB1815_00850 [Bacillota bacterium]|jgi:hypothetical protein